MRQFLSGESAGPARNGVSFRAAVLIARSRARARGGARALVLALAAIALARWAGARRSRCGLHPTRGDEHVRLELERRIPRHAALLPRASAKSPSRCSCRATSQQLLLSSDLERLRRARGLPVGQRARARAAARGRGRRALRAARARAHGEGRARPRHVRQRGRRTRSTNSSRADNARGARRGQAGRTRGHAARRSRGACRRAKRTRSATQARKVTIGRFAEELVTLALQYGLTSRTPSIDRPELRLDALVFDARKPAGTPRRRFAYLFPSREAALVSVRMKAGLSEAAAHAHDRARSASAVAMPQWRLATRRELPRHRRAGDRLGPDELDHALDRAAAAWRSRS